MSTLLPGIGGSLFPLGYLTDGIVGDLPEVASTDRGERHRRQLLQWWTMVEQECGPVTGLRTLFDRVAMPLAAMLGFRAHDACFEPARVTARLVTRRGTTVALVLQGWAKRQPSAWRDIWIASRDRGARWCLLISPPFVAVVDARGRASRRSVDFTLPDALTVATFARFSRLTHASAFDAGTLVESAGNRRTSAIERLVELGRLHQDAVGRDLRKGVATALDALVPVVGSSTTPFGEALTMIYRVLFLLFAESRSLVPDSHPVYAGAYSMASLCRDALDGASPPGAWEGLAAVTRLLRRGCATEDFTVAPFNGRLFAQSAAPTLERPAQRVARHLRDRQDDAMTRALVSLSTRTGRAGLQRIRYADLGVEELGSVYERVLDIEPAPATPAGRDRSIDHRAGRHSTRRKESGTFYTPRSLTEFVVRRTLEPLVIDRSSADILGLRVLDPAMGSGAFLVAACRFLSAAYERALLDEGVLHEADLDEAVRADLRRRVAEQCLSGVDVNPMAVELARLSIWLTTLARNRPLGFLDHRLRTGNSLLGATPADLHRIGLQRRAAKPAGLPLFDADALADTMARAARPMADLLARRDHSAHDVRDKERIWKRLSSPDGPLGRWRMACSLWCSQWLWTAEVDGPAPSPAELRAAIDGVLRDDRTLPSAVFDRWVGAAGRLESSLGLFHWPLEFPDVFHAPDGTPLESPGFDAVVGNPPWEMLRRDPGGRGGQRGLAFLKRSGVYQLGRTGHVNLYQPFVERALTLVRRGGRIGLVLPWGMASDDGASRLRRTIAEQHGLDTIVGLDNGDGLFPIHRGLRFLVLVARAGMPVPAARARFGVRTNRDLDDLPGRDTSPDTPAYPVRLSPRSLAVVGGSTGRWPDGRHVAILALAEQLAARWPTLGSADGWNVHFGRELNATDDRALFGPAGWPVLEGKHIGPFTVALDRTRHHIRPADARRALGDTEAGRHRLAYRDVSGAANRLSLIAAILPAHTASTHTLVCLREPVPLDRQHFLCGLFNSWVLNAIVRMLMGQHVTTSLVEDLPVPVWTGTAVERAIGDMARELARGRGSEPRLQAAVAAWYGIDPETFEAVTDTLPLVDAGCRRAAVSALRDGPLAL